MFGEIEFTHSFINYFTAVYKNVADSLPSYHLCLFLELEFYSWNQLRVYENIINFFTTKFSIEPSSNMSFE